jgi:curved DNA-binding protein CbpA
MEVDPYKILEIPKSYTLEQLRTQYKKIALTVHPDKTPGNSDYMFKIVTKCYKILLEEYNLRIADKQFNELKNSFIKNQETEKTYRNTQFTPQQEEKSRSRFNLDRFNKVFEDNKVDDFTAAGYDEWIRKNSIKDAPSLDKKITKENFNQQFEKYADETKDKSNKYIIKYREPEPMMMSKKLNFIELGTSQVDDFSGENRSNRDLNYMDYRLAHSTTRLVDPNVVKQRKDFNSVDDYEKERANIKKLSQKELAYIEKKKRLEESKEKQKQEFQKKQDEITTLQFHKINKILLAQSKY